MNPDTLQYELVHVSDGALDPLNETVKQPHAGDYFVGADSVPLATTSLQSSIEAFMGSGTSQGELVFPLVESATELTSENHWMCYQDRYADLQESIRRYDLAALETHYNSVGKRENRINVCNPDTPIDQHGFLVHGFMKVSFLKVDEPSSYSFEPMGSHRDTVKAAQQFTTT